MTYSHIHHRLFLLLLPLMNGFRDPVVTKTPERQTHDQTDVVKTTVGVVQAADKNKERM